MHEAGIAYQIIRQVESVCQANDLTSVVRITLELGEVAGVVESYLTDFWCWVSQKHELFQNSELRFMQIAAITTCHSCGKNYPTVPQGKQCPYCQSYDTVLLQGNEFIIRDIEAF
jgi:hydrogenase nickel incorporation protein HypA/HybF